MALVDGETFATRAEGVAYATARAWTDYLALTGDQQDAFLREGADYIATNTKWPGVLADSAQLGPFPRVGWKDREGREVTGTPTQIKSANIEAARLAISGPLLGGAQTQAVIRKKIGQLEKEYDKPQSVAEARASRLAYVHSLIRSVGGKLAGGVNVALAKS